MADRDFRVFAPVTFFEKADAPKGEQKRIAGVISTELRDKQDEVVLQRGLDFSPFLKSGWFNDNHSKRTTDVLGYPKAVSLFRKGDALPDGTRAEAAGTWAEGYLLDTPEAQKVWELGRALQKAGKDRRLGFSIEGQVQQRTGQGGKIVAKALVRNVAVTNCPVGEGTRLELLAKSLRAAEEEDLDKAASMGAATPGVNPSASGPVTGEGEGRVITPQHLEEEDEDDLVQGTREVKKASAVAVIQNRFGCPRTTAERAYGLLKETTMGEQDTSGLNLEKGLRTLEQLALKPKNPRLDELLAKAKVGALAEAERDELVKSLADSSLSARATEEMRGGEAIQKAIDVSDYLREQHKALANGLGTVADHVEKSEASAREFNVALAQTLVAMGQQLQDQGALLKSLKESVEAFGAQPARPPKSAQATAAALNKSFAGQPGGNTLSKAQVEDVMSMMIEKGVESVGGEELLKAASKYELTGMISQPVMEAVVAFAKETHRAA